MVNQGKTAIAVLDIAGCGDDLLGDFKEIGIVTTTGALEQIGWFGLDKGHFTVP
jgi:hypothetical protein